MEGFPLATRYPMKDKESGPFIDPSLQNGHTGRIDPTDRRIYEPSPTHGRQLGFPKLGARQLSVRESHSGTDTSLVYQIGDSTGKRDGAATRRRSQRRPTIGWRSPLGCMPESRNPTRRAAIRGKVPRSTGRLPKPRSQGRSCASPIVAQASRVGSLPRRRRPPSREGKATSEARPRPGSGATV